MGVTINTAKAHITRLHSGIVAIYTWINDERAMVLIPAGRPKAPWYVVMDSAAFKYTDDEYLARQSMKACEVMGMEPSKNNWVKIATIIIEGLPDLIRMPSSLAEKIIRSDIGRMQLRADGQVIAEEAIVDEQEIGATYG